MKTDKVKAKYQLEYNKKPKAQKKRAEAAKARRDLGLKKGDPRDASHKGGKFVAEHQSKNRSRGGRIGNKEGKAAGGRKSRRV